MRKLFLLTLIILAAFAYFCADLEGADGGEDPGRVDPLFVGPPEVEPLPIPPLDEPPDRPELTEALQDLKSAIGRERVALHRDLRQVFEDAALPAGAPDREVLVAAFRVEHAARIEAHTDRVRQLRSALRGLRDGNLSTRAHTLRMQIRDARRQGQLAQIELRGNLQEATAEERETLVEAFRANQRERFDEVKRLNRLFREEMRGGSDGDRRSDG